MPTSLEVDASGYSPLPDLPAESFDSPMPGVDEATFAKICSQIVLMVPHRPTEGVSESLTNANGWWARWGIRTAFPEDQFAGDIAYTRAGMVRRFREIARENPRYKYLVMIDNDEMISSVAPVALAFNDLPVVTGVVCSPSEHGGARANFTIPDVAGKPRFPTTLFTKYMPARGIRKIHSCGAGLLCIRIDVLEAIIAAGRIPFLMSGAEHDHEVREFWATGTKKLGEDTHFSRQAREAGFDLYVDFAIGAAHLKQVAVIWPMGLIDQNMDPAAWTVDAKDLSADLGA